MISRCSFLTDILAVDEELRQVFEQLRVGGALAGDAEVARRVHDAGAEVPLPDAVDDHAHRDRLLDDRVRQFQAAAAAGERGRLAGGRAPSGSGAATSSPSFVGAAADRDLQVLRLLDVLDAVNERVLRPQLLLERLDLVAQVGRCRRGARRQAGARAPSRGSQQRRLDLVGVTCCGSTPSCMSRSKTSVQRLVFSFGMLFSSRPQPGQKSSLVTNSFGRLARFFGLVPGSALALMISFSSLSSPSARTSRRRAAPGTRRPASPPRPPCRRA